MIDASQDKTYQVALGADPKAEDSFILRIAAPDIGQAVSRTRSRFGACMRVMSRLYGTTVETEALGQSAKAQELPSHHDRVMLVCRPVWSAVGGVQAKDRPGDDEMAAVGEAALAHALATAEAGDSDFFEFKHELVDVTQEYREVDLRAWAYGPGGDRDLAMTPVLQILQIALAAIAATRTTFDHYADVDIPQSRLVMPESATLRAAFLKRVREERAGNAATILDFLSRVGLGAEARRILPEAP